MLTCFCSIQLRYVRGGVISSNHFCVYPQVIFNMTGKLAQFGAVLLVIMLGFAMSFYIFFREFLTFGNVLHRVFDAMMGTVDVFDDLSEEPYGDVATGLLIVYLTIMAVMLLNLLVAVLATAHAKVEGNAEIEYKVSKARIINFYRRVVDHDILPAPFNLVQLIVSRPFKILHGCQSSGVKRNLATTTRNCSERNHQRRYNMFVRDAADKGGLDNVDGREDLMNSQQCPLHVVAKQTVGRACFWLVCGPLAMAAGTILFFFSMPKATHDAWKSLRVVYRVHRSAKEIMDKYSIDGPTGATTEERDTDEEFSGGEGIQLHDQIHAKEGRSDGASTASQEQAWKEAINRCLAVATHTCFPLAVVPLYLFGAPVALFMLWFGGVTSILVPDVFRKTFRQNMSQKSNVPRRCFNRVSSALPNSMTVGQGLHDANDWEPNEDVISTRVRSYSESVKGGVGTALVKAPGGLSVLQLLQCLQDPMSDPEVRRDAESCPTTVGHSKLLRDRLLGRTGFPESITATSKMHADALGSRIDEVEEKLGAIAEKVDKRLQEINLKLESLLNGFPQTSN